MIFHFEDYRDVLQLRFDERHSRNPAYSLRAFARDLQISPSRLSEVLSRRHHLSAQTADDIGRRLEMNDNEREYFRDLVESQTARTEKQKQQATARLQKFRFADEKTLLLLDQFKVISDWYHFAILELFKTKDFQSDSKWIAQALNISQKTAREALERLTRIGFVKAEPDTAKSKQVHYSLVKSRSFTDSDVPSQAIHDFHRQIFDQAATALQEQPKAERVTFAAMAAINQADVEPMRAEIKALVNKFVTAAAKQEQADHVYCLSTQLFRLSGAPHEP